MAMAACLYKHGLSLFPRPPRALRGCVPSSQSCGSRACLGWQSERSRRSASAAASLRLSAARLSAAATPLLLRQSLVLAEPASFAARVVQAADVTLWVRRQDRPEDDFTAVAASLDSTVDALKRIAAPSIDPCRVKARQGLTHCCHAHHAAAPPAQCREQVRAPGGSCTSAVRRGSEGRRLSAGCRW